MASRVLVTEPLAESGLTITRSTDYYDLVFISKREKVRHEGGHIAAHLL